VFIRAFCLVLLALAGCQSTPELLITRGQQNELKAIAITVTQQGKAMRKDNMIVNSATINRLLTEQDSAVRSMFTDEQWQLYDAHYRQRFASRIYREQFRQEPAPTGLSLRGDPASVPVSGGDW